jgi:hypothetical protein
MTGSFSEPEIKPPIFIMRKCLRQDGVIVVSEKKQRTYLATFRPFFFFSGVGVFVPNEDRSHM